VPEKNDLARMTASSAAAATDQRVDCATILDCFYDPLFVVDARRHVLFANAAARRVLKARIGLEQESGRLVLAPVRADKALQTLIDELARTTSPPVARGLRVARAGASRDWMVMVRPLQPPFVGESVSAAYFFVQVLGRMRPRDAPLEVLADLYDLSGRELAVIAAVLRTRSLQNAATRLSLSHETIRSHLKRIFRKCDVHSQDELMSLLHCLSQFTAAP
jgi:DNA-binding CsgD family transcriptional regulator